MNITATADRLDITKFAASPCSLPQLGYEEVIRAYAELGYRKFEMFSSWAKSHADLDTDPQQYLDIASKYGMKFCSMHLPPINDDFASSIAEAVKAARFAEKLGADIVIYKANSRDNYIKGAAEFLDAIEDTGVTPVLQNHVGSPITTIEDYREVINGINDSRMKTLLEVGQFHEIGVNWEEGFELLEGSIALVHIKDQIKDKKVPFGDGEVDFKGLFSRLIDTAYQGDIVIEMEVCRDNTERTLKLLAGAHEHCAKILEELAC